MAVGRILAGIFILSLLAIIESLNGDCDPNCTDTEEYEKVQDLYNCTNYYICIKDKPMNHPVPCPGGGTFDPDTTSCVLPSDPPCTPKCSGGDISKCKVACTDGVEIINDPSKCGTYYRCESGVPGPGQTCKDVNPYFDSNTGKCSTDILVCCEFTCDPVCVEVDTLIPDYHDSSQFYLCQSIGTPSEDFHFQCPQGQYFDAKTLACGPMIKWESSCSNLPSPSSIVTAPVTPSSIVTGSTTPSSIVTGTATPSSIVTPPVTPTSECAESMMCTALGYFPRCIVCNAEFFFCEHINQLAVVQKCTGILLFSLNLTTPYCVLPNECRK